MSLPERQVEQKFTYKDYLTWNDEERWELIDGVPFPYNMTPAPSRKHQTISRELLTEFSLYLRDKECHVYNAPFDVRLLIDEENDELTTNVVQPDIVVVCDKDKLDDKGCKGNPDLIIEVLSPSTAKKDLEIKRELYERAKVKEYWIVDPLNEVVLVFALNEDGKYDAAKAYDKEDALKVGIFEDLVIELKNIFRND
jgi:Uma2 family endonuclease